MKLRFVSIAVLGGAMSGGTPLPAQESAWIQIEAQATIEQAQDVARDYEAFLEDASVLGYQLDSEWYAIVLGPYESRDAANAARRALRNENLIPPDSFATEGESFESRFWPTGPAALDVTVPDTAPEAVDAPALGAQITVPDADTAITVPELATELAARMPETELDREAPPAPEPPGETLAEARQSEAGLDREARTELQTALRWFGHYGGAIDAAFGPATRRAMTAWQEERGHEPTGVLTTRQRAELREAVAAERAVLGLETRRDEAAGIEIDLPLAMVRFDRHEPPFAHFESRDDSGVRALLISQAGDRATLQGLFEVMQTLEIVPIEGERELRGDSFTLTGRSDDLRSHSFARLSDGAVKGYSLIWTPEQDSRMDRVLAAMRESFAPFGGTLGDGPDIPSLTARENLVSGLEVRRPERAQTGFFVDASGRVLTTLDGVAQCERITIDESHPAEIEMTDAGLGLALLRTEGLSPLAYATFGAEAPRPGAEVAVSGFSYADMLSRPILTFGALEAMAGLDGEQGVARLSIEVEQGDAGGPVLDQSGKVIGMLLGRDDNSGRVMPNDVNFAVQGSAIARMLDDAGPGVEIGGDDGRLAPAQLNGLAADITVLVSCWN